jgi:thiol peroxidase
MTVLERPEAVTLRGKPFTLLGRELQPGEPAPDFTLVGAGLTSVSLNDSAGSVRLISCVPSLDTPVCSLETKRWEERRSELGDLTMLTVSMDLPFAQSRWAAANDVTHPMLSSHLHRQFGIDYGVLIKELRLLDRAIFVVDWDGTIRYVEYVREVSSEPDYERAVAAIKALQA